MDVEICIEATTVEKTAEAVKAAYRGGAARIELCAGMDQDGLTPDLELIRTARQAFGDRPGLVVMLRPRGGDFTYSPRELALMREQIRGVAAAGANAVALGVLRGDNRVDHAAVRTLVAGAHENGLSVTFHRAIDATPDPVAALHELIEPGVDRVLTAGIRWGQQGTALDGIERISMMIEHAGDRIEVVIAGSVSPANAPEILRKLPEGPYRVSLHAYSGVKVKGQVSEDAVRALVEAAG